MTKFGMNGALGRMGAAIIRLSAEMKDMRMVGAFERGSSSDLGKPATSALSLKIESRVVITRLDAETIKECEVLIDFTEPQGALEALAIAQSAGRPIVIGTTGFSEKELKKIVGASEKVAVLLSPNMSLGANLIFELAKQAAQRLDETYDIEIVEAHHRQKKDAPSGTAKRLAEKIAEGRGWNLDEVAVYGRKGITGARPAKQIGIHVVRAGEIVGDHTALFSGPGESIEISHHAHSRNAFAKGALIAATFLKSRKKGLYDMSDVLREQLKSGKS